MEPAPYDRDQEHLKLLSIFHYIFGGLGILGSAMVGLQALVMTAIMGNVRPGPGGQTPGLPGAWFMLLLFGTLALAVLAMGICTIISGRFIAERRGRMFSIVIAALMCLSIPLGTILGVCTIIVLYRESVIRLYEEAAYPTKFH